MTVLTDTLYCGGNSASHTDLMRRCRQSSSAPVSKYSLQSRYSSKPNRRCSWPPNGTLQVRWRAVEVIQPARILAATCGRDPCSAVDRPTPIRSVAHTEPLHNRKAQLHP